MPPISNIRGGCASFGPIEDQLDIDLYFALLLNRSALGKYSCHGKSAAESELC
jgi:hypothetical protein